MPAAYLRMANLRFARHRWWSLDAALDGTGLSATVAMQPGPDDTVRVWQQLRQFQNIAPWLSRGGPFGVGLAGWHWPNFTSMITGYERIARAKSGGVDKSLDTSAEAEEVGSDV